jgi:cell division septal protein FtsQ
MKIETQGNRNTARKKKGVLKFYILAVVALVLLFLMLSPLFQIKHIRIIGNIQLSDRDIYDLAEFDRVGAMFFFSNSRAEKRILENPYISAVEITKEWPDTLIVKVTERRLSFYTEAIRGTFLYIANDGLVLESNTYYTERLPVITGLGLEQYTVGRTLEIDEKTMFDAITLVGIIAKYDDDGLIFRIDFSDLYNFKLYVNNIEVHFGDIQDADQKVRNLLAIVNSDELPNDIRGTLYLFADIERCYFSILR